MTEMFNKEFGIDVTTDKMKGFCSRKRIRSLTVDCKFKKGVPSWNKGKSFPSRGRSAETQFKKGQKPDNTFPLGTIKITTDGYKFIKIKKQVHKNECWKQYTHYLWEQKHGPVPKGYCLIHLNQNLGQTVSNENINDIGKNSKTELVRINKLNLTSTDRDLTKAGINFVKLLHKQKEVKKTK
ncbi:HNH endonuclease [Staphylococcus phage S-CoN_Ph26]|nr:HNH endonuclease [Staphylococcus phage S-CoN_Ph26]